MTPRVRIGLEVLRDSDFAPLRGARVGLVSHAAAVDSSLRTTAEILHDAPGVHLVSLFGPEHGLATTAQDLVGVASAADPLTGLPVHSLYGDTTDSLRPSPDQLGGLDVLVIDLQDVGSRYYTYQATLLYCLEAADAAGVRTVVLDRPNPLGGVAVEGPVVQPGFASFVGPHPIPTRHGMTLGELARLYRDQKKLTGALEVVPCAGWEREVTFDGTGLPWVLPSPNMPTLETAFVYPGGCLLEGTNLSEGRGTTRPFELAGAPWIDGRRLREELGRETLPGVIFRPASFTPTFHKFAGEVCVGAQVHVTDRGAFQPVRTGLALLRAFRTASENRFDWRREPYEFVHDRLAIDLLFGSDRERLALEAGAGVAEVASGWRVAEEAFREFRKDYLLY